MSSGKPAADGNDRIGPSLRNNLDTVRAAMGGSQDVIFREFAMPGGTEAALVYIDGLINSQLLHDSILESLLNGGASGAGRSLLDSVVKEILVAGDIGRTSDLNVLYDNLLSGDAVLLLDGCEEAVRIGVSGAEDRNVTEPVSQSVTRGPMEAFNENLRTNTALIRKRIKDTRLRVESLHVGRVTKTNVALVYLSGIANDKIVEEVRIRLNRIDIDGILESGNIEEWIEDKTYTPFPTVYNSERPDTIAAGVLEGRVAILVDGTPFVLLVPALFVHFFQAAEDYTQRFDISSLIRSIRYLSLVITLLAPALYIAVTTFHQEMLPTNLLINLAAQREGVPFPAFIEALLMEITYEILREAGVRMPRTVGQAVSIVGTLVIGQAAVQAGIVSAVMVIIVSITAIASYVIPSGSMSITVRMLRFLFMGLAASFGLYGILIGLITLALHVSGLRSFGIPYMAPWAPIIPEDLKDTLFRLPIRKMTSRPRLISQNNIRRQK